MSVYINKEKFSELIKGFNFHELFNELGWDHIKKDEKVKAEDLTFNLTAVGHKRDFVIFSCAPTKGNPFPDKNLRRKIDNIISKRYFEHLIIYVDENKNKQVWQLVIREPNKPIIPREFEYNISQYPELLLQKLSGLFFAIDDEDKISLPDVKLKIQEQFTANAEKVTKKFYERFRKELISFQKFIEGIENKVDTEWYASLMLNRLMFVYFIQKKGFLDKNKNYLSDKLKLTQSKRGKDKFFSFYRHFLIVLFHEGLGASKRTQKLKDELGEIPYLNGGLFDVHRIEETNKTIEIADEAFEKIFSFFDEYNWHLDNKPTATGKDINPDVLGYIFEKYINDRAAMGAYYTKEDITEYISKNTIIPFLFDQAKKECANAFRGESSLWKLLKDNPNRYIYDAVKHGIQNLSPFSKGGDKEGVKISTEDPAHLLWADLPKNIKSGFRPDLVNKIVVAEEGPHLYELRKDWNKPAPPEIALPTETYRELIERRTRYYNIREKIENGEIKEINDFITYNLNIRQFAQDAIEEYEGSDFITAFYRAISKITILDPTCGSGAFLFAALNILEPLYEGCIKRMREFIEIDDKVKGKKHSEYRAIIKEIEKHPNEKYYIYKSIILKNLYGVDIMKEATEIAKLRLFLKLVAEVDADYNKDNLGLEPLPDIDFNIRSGNTLVGFTSLKEVTEAFEKAAGGARLVFSDEQKVLKKIVDEADKISMLFAHFKEHQSSIDAPEELRVIKLEARLKLEKLNNLLNIYLANEYGINVNDKKDQKRYQDWLASHQPFHWFAEFYEIVERGGFDVIVGNPPYIEYSEIEYSILGYSTINCGNLYAFIMERSKKMLHFESYISMIVPLSGHSTERMQPLVSQFYKKFNLLYISNYSGDTHPSYLFEGVRFRLCIFIGTNNNHSQKTYSTKFTRWYSVERANLFNYLKYSLVEDTIRNRIPKISSMIYNNIISKINKYDKTIIDFMGETRIYYHNAPVHWIRAHNFTPFFRSDRDGEKLSSQLIPVGFRDALTANSFSSVLCSSIFFNWWIATSDCYHLTSKDVAGFKVNDEIFWGDLNNYAIELMNDIKIKSERRVYNYKTSGRVEYDEFYLKKSKILIDKIDLLLSQHYLLTEMETDFLINYDIKYRMGKGNENDE
ncbi:MAG: Eco57I restriction-modification methylase domain-containing protein [Ignavibacteriaceae bacterium]|nr:Eco57I restriction-modification methylase domain-containing protein [Ignavibacteriaceae bacterium]